MDENSYLHTLRDTQEVGRMTVDWKDVRGALEKDDRGKRDLLIDPRELRWKALYDDLTVEAGCRAQLSLSPRAETRLRRWPGIPVRYLRECPAVHRLVCSNGLITGVDLRPLLYKRQVWITRDELARRFKSAAPESLDIARTTTKRMAEASKKRARLPVLLVILDELELEERLRQQAIDHFISEGDNTFLGAFNALTATARELRPHERFKLEAETGRTLVEAQAVGQQEVRRY